MADFEDKLMKWMMEAKIKDSENNARVHMIIAKLNRFFMTVPPDQWDGHLERVLGHYNRAMNRSHLIFNAACDQMEAELRSIQEGT